MKRRQSARPVVVEVKRTRSSASSPPDAIARSRSSSGLWQSTPLSEVPKPVFEHAQSLVLANDSPETDAQPARRVLPSLIPMFLPSLPEPNEDTVEAASRRRYNSRVARKSQVARTPDLTAAATHVNAATQINAGASVSVSPQADGQSVAVAASTPVDRAASQSRVRRLRDQGCPELRRSEFWKRRLPRVCW